MIFSGLDCLCLLFMTELWIQGPPHHQVGGSRVH